MKWGLSASIVMPGLVPGIHVLASRSRKDVDGRDKPDHDEKRAVQVQVPGRDTSVSFEVMNSSSTGMPSLVFAMPRWIAGMMSSGFVTRSP